MKKMTLFKQRAMYCKLYRVKVKEAQNYKFHRSVQREVLGYISFHLPQKFKFNFY